MDENKSDDNAPTISDEDSEASPEVKPTPAEQPKDELAPETLKPETSSAEQSMLQEKPPTKNKSKLPMAVSGLMFVLVLVLGALVFSFQSQLSTTEDELAAADARIAELDADVHMLPASAVKVTECIPNMGFHYQVEGGTPEEGPFYLVNNDGEVIGYEIMFSNKHFVPIEAGEIPVSVLDSGPIDLNDWQFKTVDVTLLPEGHEFFEEEHYDIHMYTVTPEVQAQACE